MTAYLQTCISRCAEQRTEDNTIEINIKITF